MSSRKIHYADHLERTIGEALEYARIEFVHESESKSQVLDFYLPDKELYIEVKQYFSERVLKQLALKDNVIVLQGKNAVKLFQQLLHGEILGY